MVQPTLLGEYTLIKFQVLQASPIVSEISVDYKQTKSNQTEKLFVNPLHLSAEEVWLSEVKHSGTFFFVPL